MSYNYIQLFVDGLPVDYNMMVKDSLFVFEPVFNPHEALKAPVFTVKNEEGKLVFENLNDESLKDQVEEEIITYLKNNN